MIIDAHTHIFGEIHGRIRQGETSGGEWGQVICAGDEIPVFPPLSRATSFCAEALKKYMEIEKVNKVVLLQGSFYGNQNALVRAAVEQYPDVFAGAMFLEPFRENAREAFEQNSAFFKAVKLECSEATGFSGWMDFDVSQYLWLYREMVERNMVLVLDLGVAGSKSYQTSGVKKIVDAVPELKIVICHLGQPRGEYLQNEGMLQAWKEQLALANYGNVWFDTASLVSYFPGESYPYHTGAQMFDMALDIASPARIMMGTDFPGNSYAVSYREMLALPMIYSKFLELSEVAISAIMGLNALGVYF